MNNRRQRIFWNALDLLLFALLQNILGVSSQTPLSANILLPPDYNARVRPEGLDNGTFTVGLSVYVNNLLGVNDAAQQFSLDMTLIQEWFDPRVMTYLLYHRETLILTQTTEISKFWLPDLYFVNSRTVRTIGSLQADRSLTIRPTGVIEYKVRLSSSFNCHMWLINYPHDSHKCSFDISSLGYNSSELKIQWSDFGVNDRAEYPQQKIRSWWIDRCDNKTDRFDQLKANSCAKGSLKFTRRLGYYIIRYYLLSFLLICVAYCGFWLPVNAWPARANIILSPMFVLLTLDLTMNNEVGVGYTVSLHIWMMFFQAFLYCCLIEWALAVAWSHMINAKKRYAVMVSQSKTSGALNTEVQIPGHLNGYYFGSRGWYRKIGKWIDSFMRFVFGEVDFKADPMTRNKIDYLARIFFPLSLIFFTFMYVMLTVVRWSANFYG